MLKAPGLGAFFVLELFSLVYKVDVFNYERHCKKEVKR